MNLNPFKKPIDIATTPPTSDPIPTTPPNILEVGKEHYFKDPKSGESVYQRAMTAEQRGSIMQAMTKNAGAAQKLIMVSRQKIAVDTNFMAVEKEIQESEKVINDIITKIRDEMKLDRRWGFNPQLGILERRDPPGQ